MSFRYDINGLRAIAVIAVVLFHFNAVWVPGGFAGVDVFFVISGFLMTGIIFKGFENNSFNLFKFYVARANRIIPAMAVLCLVLLVFGWFYLPPLDYQQLGTHVASSMGFFSNINYWREFGYFDPGTHEKWLLHTWSLSVEWQFYIIYPAVLMVLKNFLSLQQIKRLLIVGVILGFGFCAYATIAWPRSAYYLLPTRAWEMMFGGIAYLYPLSLKNSQKKILELLGIGLIIGSYIFISNKTSWPGHLALLPVLGAYLLIIANNQNSVFTNNAVFQAIGKWSYSIYLWHWPVVVFGYYVEINNWWIYGIPLSILFGYLSHRFIESYKWTPWQEWRHIAAVKPVWMILSIGAFALFIHLTAGYEKHYSEAILTATKAQQHKNPYNCMTPQGDESVLLAHCYIGNKNNIKAVLIGDSHADSLTTSIVSTLNLKEDGILAFVRVLCPFVINAKSNRDNEICYKENFARIEEVRKSYAGVPIIVISRWPVYVYGQSDPKRIINGDNRPSMYFGEVKHMNESELLQEFSKNLTETLCTLPKNSPVYVTQPIPEMGRNIPVSMSKALILGKTNTDFSIDREMYLEKNAKVRNIVADAATKCGTTVLDPSEILCQSGRCIADHQGKPIYYDGDHLNEYGSELLTPMFSKYFN